MSLLHNPASIIADPSFTVAEFCELERMSRSALYNLWKQGKGNTSRCCASGGPNPALPPITARDQD